MTRNELFTVMTAGMATIAGTVMVLYATFLQNVIPDAWGTSGGLDHQRPAAILVSAILIRNRPLTGGGIVPPNPANGSMDAIVKGTPRASAF
jgi:CNT family concentrative nucleoside transporter